VHANEARPAHWLPLSLGTTRCGWLDPDTALRLAQPPSPFGLDHRGLALASDTGGPQAYTQALAFAAQRLHQAGILREWRSEQLDVYSERGEVIATIERAACRALGIETRSVQLNAFRPDGSTLAARRASHKLSDPNRWDNLAGGMIAAGENDLQALAREAYEEGGLRLEGLTVVRGARLRVQRMVAEGLMIETVQVFDVQLGADFVPVNQDGEVAAFEALSIDAALDAIEQGEFTLQASLAILDGARRSVRARPPAGQVRSCSTPET
jgi:8-oxo-dGTP pyrophosphatase MutT (NUDIX family)